MILKTPSLLQMEAIECGAVALGIILAYHKHYVSSPELRLACGISRDGSRASNIVKAARQYGMDAQGVNIQDWKEIFEIPLPCIVFWEFKHFVVVEGMHKNKVYINDPATGRRRLSPEQFSKGFTGVALIITPGKKFQKSGEAPSVFTTLLPKIHELRHTLAYIVLISLALVVPGILIPGFGKIFIDDILIRHNQDWIGPLLLGMVLTAILRSAFTWLQQIHLLRLQTKLLVSSSFQFLWHVLHLPLSFFTQRYIGDVNERISANERIAHLLSGEVSTSLVSLISMLFYAKVMLLLNWTLGWIGILTALLNATLLYVLTQSIADIVYRFLQERGRLLGLQTQGLQIIETLKASGAENIFFQRWAGYHARTINSQQQSAQYATYLQCIPQVLTGFASLLFLCLGGWFTMQGELTLGSLVALQSLFMSFQAPLQTFINIGAEIPKIRGDFARIEDVLQHPQDPRFLEETSLSAPPEKLKGDVVIRDLCFGYSNLEDPFIKNFSAEIKKGAFVSIVGPTGSGKSTIAKLIANLYAPWSGTITIAGKNLKTITPALLAHSLSLVEQETFLLTGTLRENITLWRSSISEHDIDAALQDACINEMVTEKGGLDTPLMEQGFNLSGGQKQRLDLARALAINPHFLILDEATSAVDPIVEKNIYDNLKRRRCTVINIAHRLSTVRESDHIIVLDQGRIVQQGTHAQLLKEIGLYQALYQASAS